MTDRLSHRGPDDRGTWIENATGLGHRRLAIRDLSPLGHQPIADPSGRYWMTYNGEIYNDGDLAKQIERQYGLRRKGHGDTELIPLAYSVWGVGAFERFEGMYAVAIWDTQENTMILARDPIGIKPLYVEEREDRLAFASEVKALLELPGIDRSIAPDSLASYLACGYVEPGRTLLTSIREVDPGTVEQHGLNRVEKTRFWQPSRTGEISDPQEAERRVADTLQQVVTDMRVSDVPLGVLQSGGIDSTLINLALGPGEVPSFTAVFESGSHDERDLAEKVTSALGRKHVQILVEVEKDLPALFRDMVDAADGQLADSSSLAFLLLCKAVKQHVTVALSGDGADEFFAGYDTYKATMLAGPISRIAPAGLLKSLAQLCMAAGGRGESRYPINEVLGRFFSGASLGAPDCHAAWRRLMLPRFAGELNETLREPTAGLRPYIDALQSAPAGASLLDASLIADQCFYLPGDMLQKADRMSMAAGVELRVPFLDRRLMDLAGKLDASLLTAFNRPGKTVLRSIAGSWGAPEGIAMAKKQGFNVPLARLLRGPLCALAERFLYDEAEALEDLIDPGGIRRLWRQHRDGTRNHGYAIWALLVLAVWRSTALEPRASK